MLDTLRAGAKSWISKLLIGLLVISFAIWGISGDLLNVGGDQVATVGDRKISIVEFDRAYRRELDSIGRNIGRPLSTVEGAALGIPGQVLGRLIAEAALNETADEYNLGVSDAELVRLIQSSPSFQAPGGGFDRALLARVLQANGLTEDAFVAERRLLEERRQIAAAISGGLQTPAAMLEAFNRHANEERSVEYVQFGADLAGDVAPPDDTVLAAWFEENKAEFRAPEYRRAVLLELTPEKVAKPADVSEEDIQREYDASGQRFGEPERRRILQLSLPTAEAVAEVRDALSAGKSFEEIVELRGTTVEQIELGNMTRTDLLDPAIGDAAFALAEGETSGIVEGRLNNVLLKVTEITEARKTPLAEVAGELRREIALRLAEREVLDLHDEIEDARAGGATLAEVAERFSLALDEPAPFDTAGKGTDGATVKLPDARDLISDVFESDVGIEADMLQLGRDGFLWFEVREVIPARDRTLDEVRARASEAWIAEQRAERLDLLAAELLKEVEAGKTLEAIAGERNLEVATVSGLKRSTNDAAIPADAVAGAFAGPVGTTGSAARDEARFVYRVAAISTPAFFREAGEIAALDARLADALQNSVIGQYVGERETRLGVSVNQVNINRVIGQGGN
jgi:peptidyl-prolyl cis-trans isomerase D